MYWSYGLEGKLWVREKFESFLERCPKAAVPAGESGLETSLQSIAIELTLATAAPPAGRGPEPGCRATCAAVASAEVGATACESNNAWLGNLSGSSSTNLTAWEWIFLVSSGSTINLILSDPLTIPTPWRSEGWACLKIWNPQIPWFKL